MFRRKTLSHPYLFLVLVPWSHLGHNSDLLCWHQGTQLKSLSLFVASFFPYFSLMTWLEMLLSAEPLVTLLSPNSQNAYDYSLMKWWKSVFTPWMQTVSASEFLHLGFGLYQSMLSYTYIEISEQYQQRILSHKGQCMQFTLMFSPVKFWSVSPVCQRVCISWSKWVVPFLYNVLHTFRLKHVFTYPSGLKLLTTRSTKVQLCTLLCGLHLPKLLQGCYGTTNHVSGSWVLGVLSGQLSLVIHLSLLLLWDSSTDLSMWH